MAVFTCPQCGSPFKDGKPRVYCSRKCYQVARIEARAIKEQPDGKICSMCKVYKLRDNYFVMNHRWDRMYSCCKECFKLRYPSKDISKRRRFSKYPSLTPLKYRILMKRQKNKCAICGIPFSESKDHIDHCHSSGVVRGLLCSPCNVAIGFMKDDPERLRSAAKYLEGHRGI